MGLPGLFLGLYRSKVHGNGGGVVSVLCLTEVGVITGICKYVHCMVIHSIAVICLSNCSVLELWLDVLLRSSVCRCLQGLWKSLPIVLSGCGCTAGMWHCSSDPVSVWSSPRSRLLQLSWQHEL